MATFEVQVEGMTGVDITASINPKQAELTEFLRDAVLDVTHKSDEITRFFGVITQLTEDYATGKISPKWAVTMQISHVIEMSSTGALTSDKISIGGALTDDGKYANWSVE